MTQVIPLEDRVAKTVARRMTRLADEIDSLILCHLGEGQMDAAEVAGLLAHRLGSLMKHCDRKARLWDVCEQVLKRQAQLD